ncbi:hypothetical protein TNCV_2239451, partial [Trichonephila clavipes]
FSSGLHGNTAADSVRSEWPLWACSQPKHSPSAGRKSKHELKLKRNSGRETKLWTLERERRTREVYGAGVTF